MKDFFVGFIVGIVLVFGGCAATHQPEKDGVWISVPKSQVQCVRVREEQVVCKSINQIPVEESGI